MHIKNIEINNFRNFSEFKIGFTDGFQTIIGENNIGKSNLFWAIRLVLDKDLSYNARNLEEKDFNNYPELAIDSYISISIEFSGDNLKDFPNLHAVKSSNDSIRLTYVFIHKSKLSSTEEEFDVIELEDFQWRLFGGGGPFIIENIKSLNPIRFSDIEGINLFSISGFRNINSDLFGSSKSLLSQYCKTRISSEEELKQVKDILSTSTEKLNDQDFIPEISQNVIKKNREIAGNHFSFPISLGFLSNNDSEVWNQLKIFFKSDDGKDIPMSVLGLGQKNLLYLSLFLSKLVNQQKDNEINILLIEEPEAHLHPQLQKVLFSKLGVIQDTQVFMSSHSTHIASDCEYKNLNVLFKNDSDVIKSFSPFIENFSNSKEEREQLLLKRYLDATRSELFFSSSIIFVEGVAEQFLIPCISRIKYGVDLTEHNISVIPIHSRFFDPFLKLVQEDGLEIPTCAIIDGDSKEHKDDESTTAVENARKLEVQGRVQVFEGVDTLEIDLFPTKSTNSLHLKKCFENLGHKTSYNNLETAQGDWGEELIKRIDGTVKKGRFAQELSILIDSDFVVPEYLKNALEFIYKKNNIDFNDGSEQ